MNFCVKLNMIDMKSTVFSNVMLSFRNVLAMTCLFPYVISTIYLIYLRWDYTRVFRYEAI